MRILVVDDDPAVSGALQRALRLDGYEVTGRPNGPQALEELAIRPPDAMILDIGLPDLDGLDVCRRMRPPATTRRCSCSRPATPSRTGSRGSTPGPTTTSSSRSRWPSCSPAYAPCSVAGPTTPASCSPSATSAWTRSPATPAGATGPSPSRGSSSTSSNCCCATRARSSPASCILDRVWGYTFDSGTNSLAVYVGYLRRKTEEGGEPRLIHTARGVGYVLREP